MKMKMITKLALVMVLIHASAAVAQDPEAPDEPATAEAPMKKEIYKPAPKDWKTLNGSEPVVIARGGFSGLLPANGFATIKMAVSTCLSNLIVYCNLQFSKDGLGVCLTDINLDTIVDVIDKPPKSTINLNGKDVDGWFSKDYTMDQLSESFLLQSNKERSDLFDGLQRVIPVDIVTHPDYGSADSLWLNVPYHLFYSQHNISVENYITDYLQPQVGDKLYYISSPEIGFLKSIGEKVDRNKVKLVFVVQEPDEVELTTNQTFESVVKDLTAIKSFASGIVLPKAYIFPVNPRTKYLEPPTTIVNDAHQAGLEVYATPFANDLFTTYNYSFDPVAEYVNYIDNSQFAVDGFITDFPATATEAIVCFALTNLTHRNKDNPLIISRHGASQIYAGSTDLAYQQAVDDGADIIDCTVQMSKDGVAFCLESPDLIGRTTAMTDFMSRATTIPEILKDAKGQPIKGIFSFDLTWDEIQSLKPQTHSIFSGRGEEWDRNPKAKNKGNFVTLDGFLELAKAKAVSGILIIIDNAAYLASKKGLGLVDAITKALSNATFDKQSTQQVMVQSDDTSVLSQFKDIPAYKKVLHISKEVSKAPKEVVEEISKYATAVVVQRPSIMQITDSLTTNDTSILRDFHTANISVYVSAFRNEFASIAFDFWSDPYLEIATFAKGVGVDGIVTESPATASKYFRSKCWDEGEKQEFRILPAQSGALYDYANPEIRNPIHYRPALEVADIVRPALPPVSPVSPSTPGSSPAPQGGGVTMNAASLGLTLVAIIYNICVLYM